MEANQPLRILFVEDVPADAELAQRALRANGLTCTTLRVETKDAFCAALTEFQPDLIISDYALPDFTGLQALQLSLAQDALLPVIILTSRDEETAVACMKAGATDYVIKQRMTRLPFAVREALEQKQARLAQAAAERALRDSEERLREVLENSLDAFYKRNIQTTDYAYLSPVFAQLTGYTPAEMRTLPAETVWGLIHPDDWADIRRIIAEAKSDPAGMAYQVDYRFKHKDGQYRWHQDRFTVMRDASGQPVSIIGGVRDITDRKRAEEALRESEARYRALFEHLPVPVFTKNRAGQYTSSNAANLQYWAVNPIGQTDAELLPRETAAALREADRRVMDTGDALTTEEHLYTPLGERYLVARKVPLYDTAGQISGVLGVSLDITERKQLEQALTVERDLLEQRVRDRTRELADANAHLQDLDRLKDEFISRINHELLTPLVNIKLYLGLLDHGKPEKYEQYMATLLHEAARLQQLLDDLLRISAIDMATFQFRLAPIDLNQLLAQLVIDRAGLAQERGLQIESRPAPDLPKACADLTLLMQALSNLMTNATSYTPRGGTITLSTALQSGDDQVWVTCTVRDTGPGISAKDRPHIFERFYRGEAAKDYAAPGTGLGLSISQKIVEKLGGRLTVESEPHHGAAFTVWLKPA